MIKTAKKILSLFLSLAIVLSLLLSVSAFAQSGDVTGGESRFDDSGHILTYLSETPATCTEQGYKVFYCEICEKEYNFDYTDAAGHIKSDWIIDVEPTASAEGHRHTECTVCKVHFDEEDIPKTGYTAGDINKDGFVNNKDLTSLFHYLSGWNVSFDVDKALLDVNGDKAVNNKDLTRLFKYLSGYSVKIYPAPGHDYESAVTAPTCTERGYTTYTCSLCGDSYVDDYTDALGHDYAAAVTPPTCTEQGYTTYTCSRCGDSYVDDYTGALNHQHTEIRNAKSATSTETGYTGDTYCLDCGAKIATGETIPATVMGSNGEIYLPEVP